jgi:hypothetical protein
VKSFRLLVGAVVVALVLYVAWLRYAPDKVRWRGEISRGNDLVRQIENFRSLRGRLPDSLGELGAFEENQGKLFYEKCNRNHYIVWFGTTLGESITYDSADGRWDALNGPCSSRSAGETGESDSRLDGRLRK